jgi:hypothetical protein
MKRIVMLRKNLVASSLILFLCGAAQADTLFTPPLFDGGSDAFECELANVSSGDRVVRIQIIDADGIVLSDSGDFILPAGRSDFVAFQTRAELYCRFDVQAGKDDYRGSAAMFNNSGSDFVAVPAR